MNYRLLLLFNFLVVTSNAQTINDVFFERMDKLPINVGDLKFEYKGVDTVTGVEIIYYYKRNNQCDAHVFFIEQQKLSMREKKLPLKTFLIKSNLNYHYIKFDNYASFFGCEYNDIDTFEICRNEKEYRNILSTVNSSKFYKANESEFFKVSMVQVAVYRFLSDDLKYVPFFYHFSIQKAEKIEKYIYKRILTRHNFTQKCLFRGLSIPDTVVCISTYH